MDVLSGANTWDWCGMCQSETGYYKISKVTLGLTLWRADTLVYIKEVFSELGRLSSHLQLLKNELNFL